MKHLLDIQLQGKLLTLPTSIRHGHYIRKSEIYGQKSFITLSPGRMVMEPTAKARTSVTEVMVMATPASDFKNTFFSSELKDGVGGNQPI
jgi:hypothetical protein